MTLSTAAEVCLPTYGYDCAPCGPFDLSRPMKDAAVPATCPACGCTGRRVFGAPAFRSVPSALRTALDAQHRSGDAPRVVTTPPPRRGRVQRQVTDPRQARLPRP